MLSFASQSQEEDQSNQGGLEAASTAFTQNNPYTILGLGHGASLREVRKAWKNLCLKWHPDKCGHLKAVEMFCRINEAYSEITLTQGEVKSPSGPLVLESAQHTMFSQNNLFCWLFLTAFLAKDAQCIDLS